MKLLIHILPAAVLIVSLFLDATPATAQIQLASLSINSGGVTQTSTNYGATLTIGQAVSGVSTSTNYQAMLGFWHAVSIGVGVFEMPPGELPATFSLAQNYPNPFNPSTQISFSLPRTSDVRLDIYNILGQRVTRLVNEKLSAGDYVADWNGYDRAGRTVASGIYFYRLKAGDFVETRRMVLLK